MSVLIPNPTQRLQERLASARWKPSAIFLASFLSAAAMWPGIGVWMLWVLFSNQSEAIATAKPAHASGNLRWDSRRMMFEENNILLQPLSGRVIVAEDRIPRFLITLYLTGIEIGIVSLLIWWSYIGAMVRRAPKPIAQPCPR